MCRTLLWPSCGRRCGSADRREKEEKALCQRQDSGTDPGGRLDMTNKNTDTPRKKKEEKGGEGEKKAFVQNKKARKEKNMHERTALFLSVP